MKSAGVTLVELLVVMAIVAIAFGVLAAGAIANLRGTSQSRASTEVKGVAVKELERLSNVALHVDRSTSPYTYDFSKYYNNCTVSPLPSMCKGQDTATGLSWEIRSEKGAGTTQAEKYAAEGQLLIFVQATGSNNASYSISRRISCYDVYPTPLTTAADPCPPTGPTAGGGS